MDDEYVAASCWRESMTTDNEYTIYTPNAFSIQRVFDLRQIVLNDEHLKQARKFLKYMQKDEPSYN